MILRSNEQQQDRGEHVNNSRERMQIMKRAYVCMCAGDHIRQGLLLNACFCFACALALYNI